MALTSNTARIDYQQQQYEDAYLLRIIFNSVFMVVALPGGNYHHNNQQTNTRRTINNDDDCELCNNHDYDRLVQREQIEE